MSMYTSTLYEVVGEDATGFVCAQTGTNLLGEAEEAFRYFRDTLGLVRVRMRKSVYPLGGGERTITWLRDWHRS